MASCDDNLKAELEKCFEEYAKVTGKKDPKTLTSQGCGKMVKEGMSKDLCQRADSSVFSKLKAKSKVAGGIGIDQFEEFIHGCAWEWAKMKSHNDKLPEDDPKVAKCEQEFRQTLSVTRPVVAGVKISKTGGVDKMTDSSKYTGAHKERFDEKGQGKGKVGRENLHSNDGYVGQYKGKDTYGTKK